MRVTHEDVVAAIRDARFGVCVVPGCERPRCSKKGFCNAHRFRERVSGDAQPEKPLRVANYNGATCVEEGCGRRPVGRNRCPRHYRRYLDQYGTGRTPPSSPTPRRVDSQPER